MNFTITPKAQKFIRMMMMSEGSAGAGFRLAAIPHAAVSNPPDDPTSHLEKREAQGMRAGGYGILVARNVVDEMMYSEVGNEVLLIKYTNGDPGTRTEKIALTK